MFKKYIRRQCEIFIFRSPSESSNFSADFYTVLDCKQI